MRLSRAFLCTLTILFLGIRLRADDALEALLARTSQQTAVFLDQFSNVKCTEQVRQEKLKPDGKQERDVESTYDYLIILSNNGGELSLNESRLEIR